MKNLLLLMISILTGCGFVSDGKSAEGDSETDPIAQISGSTSTSESWPDSIHQDSKSTPPNRNGADTGTFSSNPTNRNTVVVDGQKLSAGKAHTCALTKASGVKCWGLGDKGQLGNNSTRSQNIAVEVVGLSSGVKAISAGDYHTCALTASGGVKCWGLGFEGQLGNGSTENQTSPVDVFGLSSGVVAISAGGSHSCALTLSGSVKCWGDGGLGQLGNGILRAQRIPTDVVGLSSGVTYIDAGEDHTCASIATGGVKCWGVGSSGQLGTSETNGTWLYFKEPVEVIGLSRTNVTAIAAGHNHTCALDEHGGARCWGLGIYGQIGNNATNQSQRIPVDVVGLSSGAMAIAAGENHSCAIVSNGGLKCWGSDYYGEQGNEGFANAKIPTDVSSLMSQVTAVAAGRRHTCAMIGADSIKCWGEGFYGQLGNGSFAERVDVPVDVVGL